MGHRRGPGTTERGGYGADPDTCILPETLSHRRLAAGGRVVAVAGVTVAAALRLLRAGAFAAVCVALTALGHELAGGATVGLAALFVGFVALFVAGLALGGRERPGPVIGTAMLAGQVGLHAFFVELGGPMTGMAGGGPMCSGGAMVVVHVGLAVVSGWWLRQGELACWRLVRRVESGAAEAFRSTVRHLAGVVVDPCAGRPGPAHTAFAHREPVIRMTSLRARCAPRRGPPWASVSTAGGRV